MLNRNWPFSLVSWLFALRRKRCHRKNIRFRVELERKKKIRNVLANFGIDRQIEHWTAVNVWPESDIVVRYRSTESECVCSNFHKLHWTTMKKLTRPLHARSTKNSNYYQWSFVGGEAMKNTCTFWHGKWRWRFALMKEMQSADVAKLMDLKYKRAASASAAILFISSYASFIKRHHIQSRSSLQSPTQTHTHT